MFFNDAYGLREHDRLERANDQHIRRQMEAIKDEEFAKLKQRVEDLEDEIKEMKRVFSLR